MAYEMRDPFVIPTLVDGYNGAVENCWEAVLQQGYTCCPAGRSCCYV